jgi:hypothetical protein
MKSLTYATMNMFMSPAHTAVPNADSRLPFGPLSLPYFCTVKEENTVLQPNQTTKFVVINSMTVGYFEDLGTIRRIILKRIPKK